MEPSWLGPSSEARQSDEPAVGERVGRQQPAKSGPSQKPWTGAVNVTEPAFSLRNLGGWSPTNLILDGSACL